MVNIDISASGNAASVIAATQAAIDSLRGKTVFIDVIVRQHGNAQDVFARAVDAAAGAAERYARASDRASASAGAHARASERAGSAMGGLGDNANRASGGLDRTSQSSAGASVGVGKLGRSSRDADRSVGDLGGSVGGLGRSLGGIGDGAGGAARGVSGLARSASDMGVSLGSVAGFAGSAMSGLRTFGAVSAYAAAGSGLLTGAVGALGAVGVGALGGVGAAAGAAGGAMAAFAVDAHKDSAKFGGALESLGKSGHLAAQAISEPMAAAMVGLGQSMVSAEGVLTPAGAGIVSSLTQGFSNAAGVISGSSGSIVDAAGTAAAGFARLTGEAAPGVSAFLSQLPSLTQGAVSGMSQITSEFGASAGAIAGATPALNRAMGAVGGLGAALVRTGAGSVVPFAENVASMAGSVTGMVGALGPAVKPSMQAVTDAVGAAAGGIGSLAPNIAGFAETVSANAPAMESVVNSLGGAMLSMGSATVAGVAQAAPALAEMAGAIQANQGAIANTVGALAGGAADVIGFGANVAGGIDRFQGGAGFGGGTGADHGNAIQRGLNAFDSFSANVGATLGLNDFGTPLGGGGGGGAAPGAPTARAAAMGGGGAPGGGAVGALMTGEAMSSAPITGPNGPSQAFSQLFTGGVQSAQQAGTQIPALMQASMAQTRAAVESANLGGAVQPQMDALTNAIGGGGAGARPPGGGGGGGGGGGVGPRPAAAGGGGGGGGGVRAAISAAGARGGVALGQGFAQGTEQSMTVVDKILVNRVQQFEELLMGAMDAHSPSRRFAKVGGYIPQGFDRGVIKGFDASAASAVTADSIAARGSEAMAATGSAMRGQEAEADRYRSVMQSMVIKVPNVAKAAAKGDPRVAMPAPVGALMPWTDEERAAFAGPKGTAKQEAFGETPGGPGARQVFDKKTFGWEAKPGVEMATGNAFSPDMVQSELRGPQRAGMEAMQSWLDKGASPNSQQFGERTQQNILRNRPGAFNVAGAIAEHEARQGPRTQETAGGPKDVLPQVKDFLGVRDTNGAVGGSGGGGFSYLGKDRIAAVREAAGLGKDVAAGLGKGINDGTALAVDPLGNVTKRQQKKYTDDWGIRSPSTVAAGYGGDIMAGAGQGLVSNAGLAVGAMGQVATAMQAPMSDFGLKVGYTFSNSILDGSTRVLEKASLKSLGIPKNLAAAAMLELARTGLLRAGGGASTSKTASGAPAVLVLNMPEQDIRIGEQAVATIADRRIELAFDEATDTYSTLRG